MAITQDELASFNRFVLERIRNGGSDLSWDEVFDLWRIENPTDEEFAENVAAVQASIDDLKSGHRGIPVEEHLRAMRKKYDLPSDE